MEVLKTLWVILHFKLGNLLIHIQAKLISRLLLLANLWISAVHFCSLSKPGLATQSGKLISCGAYPEEGLKEWQFLCCFCCSHAVVQRICRTKRNQNQTEWTGLGMSIPSSQLSDSAFPPSASQSRCHLFPWPSIFFYAVDIFTFL